jgi:pimeloyl-ACP methyl ester carboxylesterase
MAHGFAAERSFRLPAFASEFVDKGMAVFLFDYRNFGDSEGEPRNLVNPLRHVRDWGAAISHVRGLPEVDSSRLALWGSSYSGGHVMVAAAKYGPVAAVVSQVPFVDGISTTFGFSLGFIAKCVVHGIRDILRLVTFRSPYLVPVIGLPSTFAMMNTPESYPGYMAIVPDDSEWRNECPARAAITLALYRPVRYASRIKCPVLVIAAEKDSLISLASVRRTARKIKHSQVVPLPVGHFDPYVGEWFDRVVEIEGDFLREHLLSRA